MHMPAKFLMLSVACAAIAGLTACESYPWTPAQKDPGVYKTTQERVSPSGTKTTTNQTTSVYRDTDGQKKAVVKTEQTRDPKGLFNKEKTTTYKTYN
jgi:hypothetical protein